MSGSAEPIRAMAASPPMSDAASTSAGSLLRSRSPADRESSGRAERERIAANPRTAKMIV